MKAGSLLGGKEKSEAEGKEKETDAIFAVFGEFQQRRAAQLNVASSAEEPKGGVARWAEPSFWILCTIPTNFELGPICVHNRPGWRLRDAPRHRSLRWRTQSTRQRKEGPKEGEGTENGTVTLVSLQAQEKTLLAGLSLQDSWGDRPKFVDETRRANAQPLVRDPS